MVSIKETANLLLETIKDYRKDDGISLDADHIIRWANQFGEDAPFILKEVSHIIPQVYISKEKAKSFVESHISELLKKFKYKTITAFLMDTEFLNLQEVHKSQPAILNILEDILNERYGESYLKYTTYPKVNFVYFDDLLASGSTVGNHLDKWLNLKNQHNVKNIDNVLNDNFKLSVNLFCVHTWGHAFQKFRLKKNFNDKIDKKISWSWFYEIQNHAKFTNHSFNTVFPTDLQPANVKTYLASLIAEKYED